MSARLGKRIWNSLMGMGPVRSGILVVLVSAITWYTGVGMIHTAPWYVITAGFLSLVFYGAWRLGMIPGMALVSTLTTYLFPMIVVGVVANPGMGMVDNQYLAILLAVSSGLVLLDLIEGFSQAMARFITTPAPDGRKEGE